MVLPCTVSSGSLAHPGRHLPDRRSTDRQLDPIICRWIDRAVQLQVGNAVRCALTQAGLSRGEATGGYARSRLHGG
jgi:hypothetical protein